MWNRSGWAILAEVCDVPEKSPLQKMVDLGLSILTSANVPRGQVIVINKEALDAIPMQRRIGF
jgi:hypothetical protein